MLIITPSLTPPGGPRGLSQVEGYLCVHCLESIQGNYKETKTCYLLYKKGFYHQITDKIAQISSVLQFWKEVLIFLIWIGVHDPSHCGRKIHPPPGTHAHRTMDHTASDQTIKVISSLQEQRFPCSFGFTGASYRAGLSSMGFPSGIYYDSPKGFIRDFDNDSLAISWAVWSMLEETTNSWFSNIIVSKIFGLGLYM